MILESILQDVRIGTRLLIKEKSFCALAVTVLALGICSITTMFSVVNGTMIRGFSFPNADRLASVQFIDPTPAPGNFFGPNNLIFALDYEEFRTEQKSFERMAAFINQSTVNIAVDGAPSRLTGAYVTQDFLRVLGVAPVIGRDFVAADNSPGAEKVTILSDKVWKREFGGDRNIVGRRLTMNGKPATVIGVMAPGFAFPNNEEIWSPLYNEFPPKPRNDRTAQGNAPAVFGALKPGVSLDQANAEFSMFAKRFAEAYPDTNKQFNAAQVETLLSNLTGPFQKILLTVMLGFCVGLLLIACANVMNMQFARATLRAKELAIRSSLGATRLRLVCQMLTESLLLSVVGAVLGVGLSYWAIDFLTAVMHNLEFPPPSYVTYDIDARVLALVVAATLLSAIVSGLVPALVASGTSATDALKDSGRGNTGRAVHVITRGLVVFQILLTCVLLIAAMLQLRTIRNQLVVDYGYDTAGIMSARVGLMDGQYPSSDARQHFFDTLLRTLRANPQIEAAAVTNRFRMVFSGNTRIELEGHAYDKDTDRPNTSFEQVTPGYFGVTQQRLIEGRDLADDDTDMKLPVAVVSANFAKKYFGHDSALGRRFRLSLANGTQFTAWRTIVGVVTDVRMLGPFNNPQVTDDAGGYYVPLAANLFSPASAPAQPAEPQFATIAVRPRGGQRGEALTTTLRDEVRKVDASLPLYFVNTPKANQDTFTAQGRINAGIVTIVGIIAFILASVGLYGVMSFTVSQRAQEFGIRMALGADAQRILGMVLRQGAWQIVLGLALGLGLALIVSTVFQEQIQASLFNISSRDPVTYIGVATILATVSLVAALVPARRATKVDPMVALRAE